MRPALRAWFVYFAVSASGLSASLSASAADKTEYPPLPQGISSFGAAVADGHVYVYGGHTGQSHYYSIDTVTGKFRSLNITDPSKGWQELPTSTPAQGTALVHHQGKLYRIGGMQPTNKEGDPSDNKSTANCAAFNLKTNQWEPLPDLPAGRSSHDAAIVDNLLVVIGGWEMKGKGAKANWHDTALILDLSQPKLAWKSVPQPFKRRALNVAALDGKVYAVAGMTHENEMDKSTDILDPRTEKWTSGPSLPGPVMNGFTPACCTAWGRIFASPPDGKIYRLSEKKDAWEEVGAVQTKRLVHRIVPIRDNVLLVMGGGSKEGSIAKVEAVEVSLQPIPKKASTTSADQQLFCPVMVTVPIDTEFREVDFQGTKIKICCATCAKKFAAEPEAYLNVALLPQLKNVSLPARKIEQRFCPVFTDRVVSSKDPSAEYNGRTVYFFNESAKTRFLAEPARYAANLASK